MTRGDKLLILLILASSLLSGYFLYFHNSNKDASHQAVISVSGKIVQRVSLSDSTPSQHFRINGKVGETIIAVAGRKIRVENAACVNQICVHQGWIERAGESIVCMPGEVVISIEGVTGVDAVTR